MRLVARFEASPRTGLGHAGRCIAVLEEWARRGLHAVAVTGDELPAALRRPGIEIRDPFDWGDPISSGDALLIDGYDLDDDLSAAERAGVSIVFDDGMGISEADLLIMPSGEEKDGSIDVLSGPPYAPVRREFLPYRRRRGDGGDPLLIALGSAGGAFEASVLQAACDAGIRSALLVRPFAGESPSSPQGIDVELIESPQDPAAIFDRAGFAVCAAGHTVWELATIGMPLLLAVLADNQLTIARRFEKAGAALGPVDPSVRDLVTAVDQLRDNGPALSAMVLDLVDGRGAARVVDAIIARLS